MSKLYYAMIKEAVYCAMIREAADLFPDYTEWDTNPEYMRGMCEMIARMCPVLGVATDERAEQVRDSIRLRLEPVVAS